MENLLKSCDKQTPPWTWLESCISGTDADRFTQRRFHLFFRSSKIDLYYGPRWVSFWPNKFPRVLLIFFASQMNLFIVAMPLNWQNWRDGKEANFLIKLMCQFAELWITSWKPQMDSMAFLGRVVFFFFLTEWMIVTNSDKPGLRWKVTRFHPRLPKVESRGYPPQSHARELSHFSVLSSLLHCTLTQVLQSLETTYVLEAKETLEPIRIPKHCSINTKEEASRLGSKSKMLTWFPVSVM